MTLRLLLAAASMTLAAVVAQAASPAGEATRGAQIFRACAGCHSLIPNRDMTGPSLAGLWGRKAGSLKSFERYSPALKAANLVWDEKSLDAWLTSPSVLIPDNKMTFPGIADAEQRADLIAFLKAESSGDLPAKLLAQSGGTRGFTDLKKLGPDYRVTAIRYCPDTYYVTTADGKTAEFWEANLRLKTDSSGTGPLAGKPVIVPAGMVGDRASVFFAAPGEISTFIRHQC